MLQEETHFGMVQVDFQRVLSFAWQQMEQLVVRTWNGTWWVPESVYQIQDTEHPPVLWGRFRTCNDTSDYTRTAFNHTVAVHQREDE